MKIRSFSVGAGLPEEGVRSFGGRGGAGQRAASVCALGYRVRSRAVRSNVRPIRCRRERKGKLKAGFGSYCTLAHQLFFNEIDGFEANSRPYLLKCDAPCRSFDSPSQTTEYFKILFSWHPSSCRAAMKRSSKTSAASGGGLS